VFFNASVSGRRDEGAAPILEGKRSMHGDSCFSRGGATRGYNGAATTGSRSQSSPGLTRCERQSLRPVGPTCYLGRLFGSNKLRKWNELGKIDSWAEIKLWRRIWDLFKNIHFKIWNLFKKFKLKTREIRIKPRFGIFLKIYILRFHWKD
jgi:hypothetical protein